MRVRIRNSEPNINVNIDGIDFPISKSSIFYAMDEDDRVPLIKMGGLVKGENQIFKFPFDSVASPSAVDTDDLFIQIAAFVNNHGHGTSTLATEGYVDAAVAGAIEGLIDNAPEALNTLKELSAALDDNPEIVDNILTALDAKVEQPDIDTAIELATENPSTVRAFVADVNLIAEVTVELVPAKAGYRFVPLMYNDTNAGSASVIGGYIITAKDGTLVSDAIFTIGIVGNEDLYNLGTSPLANGGGLNDFQYLINGDFTSVVPSPELTNPINVKVTTAAVLLTATEYRCQVIIYGFYLQLV